MQTHGRGGADLECAGGRRALELDADGSSVLVARHQESDLGAGNVQEVAAPQRGDRGDIAVQELILRIVGGSPDSQDRFVVHEGFGGVTTASLAIVTTYTKCFRRRTQHGDSQAPC